MAPPRTRKAPVLEGEIVSAVETEETGAVPVKAGSLTIKMRRPTDDQFAVLAKVSRAAERDPEGNSVRAIEVFFKILATLLDNPADGERIEDALIDGKVTLREITRAMGREEEDEDARPTTAQRARRGR